MVLLHLPQQYGPIANWGGAGAAVPLTGFGSNLAKGVAKAVGERGWLGVMTGGLAQDRCRAAASAGPGVHVLALDIVEEHSAVLVILAHVDAIVFKKFGNNLVPKYPQIPGQHKVVILRFGSGSLEVGGEGVIGGGGRGPGRGNR